MMPLRLELFETEQPVSPTTVVTDIGTIEQAKLTAYEQGYAAGWDDGVAAQSEDQTRLRADLGRSLQGLSFTFQEARSHVLRALEPLIESMLSRFLPVAARSALAPMVIETLRPLASELADAPVAIYINPAVRPAVASVLSEGDALPVTLVDEPMLGEGQAVLRLGQIEARVDLDAALSSVAEAVHHFFQMSQIPAPVLAPQTESPHG